MASAPQWLTFQRTDDLGITHFVRVDLSFQDPEQRDGCEKLAELRFSWPAPKDDDDFESLPEVRAAEIEISLTDALAEQADVLLAGEITRETGCTVYLYYPAAMPIGEVHDLLKPLGETGPFTTTLRDDAKWEMYTTLMVPTAQEENLARQVACFGPLIGLEEDLSIPREVILFFAFATDASREAAHRDAMKAGRKSIVEESEYGVPMLGFVLHSDVEIKTIESLVEEHRRLVSVYGGKFEMFDAEVFNAGDEEFEDDGEDEDDEGQDDDAKK